MRLSTKFLIKQSAWMLSWSAFSVFWIVNATLPLVVVMHCGILAGWFWMFCLSKHSAIAIWKLMRRIEALKDSMGILV